MRRPHEPYGLLTTWALGIGSACGGHCAGRAVGWSRMDGGRTSGGPDAKGWAGGIVSVVAPRTRSWTPINNKLAFVTSTEIVSPVPNRWNLMEAFEVFVLHMLLSWIEMIHIYMHFICLQALFDENASRELCCFRQKWCPWTCWRCIWSFPYQFSQAIIAVTVTDSGNRN